MLRIAAVLAIILTLTAIATESAHAQSYSVIHNFTGGQDGATPMAGLTIDNAGNLYGAANFGGKTGGNCGSAGCGVVYRMARRNSSWVLTPLYSFAGGNDGTNPQTAAVLIGSDGTLYSTTFSGGGGCDGSGCGTVLQLQPPASICDNTLCFWTENILHRFASGGDGEGPVGPLVFDLAGNLNGVTSAGGSGDGGAVYQLIPSDDWLESIVFNPYGYPGSGVSIDQAGNLYGSTFNGADGFGSVYQLTPSGSGWISANLYSFADGADGAYPIAGVIPDAAGNLYGATSAGGSGHGGTVFELAPSGGNWIFTTLYSFARPPNGLIFGGPVANLVMDSAGNLYGTTLADGAFGNGAVFKLTPSNGSWTYTSLHDFSGGSDGGYPYSNLVFDPDGNLYGTASTGGTGAACEAGCGVVWEITP
jgi:uncharacterized repeat protein (TIGR03803 family)